MAVKKRKPTSSPYISVRKSKIHSTGVFAKKNISEGTKIMEYVGDKLSRTRASKKAEDPLEQNRKNCDVGAVYLFELNSRYDLDGNVDYNTARYINHSCDPNAESDIIRGRVWIIALKYIKKGEEISYNYNYNYEDHEEHPCHCGAKNCLGYILAREEWWKIKRKRTLQKKKSRRLKQIS